MIYPDTSVLVAIYVGEPNSGRVRNRLDADQDELAVSGWLHAELASALAANERLGRISAERRRAALANFERQWLRGAAMLSITLPIYRRAAGMIDQAAGLRSGDALHLATAEAHQATLVTLDRQQASLGQKLGVTTELL